MVQGIGGYHASVSRDHDRQDKKGRKTTDTQFVGGEQTVTRCLYTFIAARNPQANSWIVTGIREPSLDCAIGGLS
jgi:hypothetical protein